MRRLIIKHKDLIHKKAGNKDRAGLISDPGVLSKIPSSMQEKQ
jgi:hypothetical protein